MRPIAVGSTRRGPAPPGSQPVVRADRGRLRQLNESLVVRALADSGLLGAIRGHWGRARRRALADQWIAWGAVPRAESRLLGPRSDELTSEKSRRALAKVCRRYVAEIHDPRCRAYAVNRIVLAKHFESLAQLGARLDDLSKPVSAHSILLAREVVDGNGPLFNRHRGEELGPAIRRALRALEEDTALSARGD